MREVVNKHLLQILLNPSSDMVVAAVQERDAGFDILLHNSLIGSSKAKTGGTGT